MKTIQSLLAVAMSLTIAMASLSSYAQVGAAGALAVTVSPDQKAAVKELLDAMNFKQMMMQMTASMTQNMPKMMDQMFASNTKMSDGEKIEARKSAGKASESATRAVLDIYNDPQILQGIEDIMARMYAKNFTVDEVKAITAFYVSPAGKKTLTTLPLVMQQTMPEIMGLIAPRMNAAITKIADEVAEEVKKNSKTNKSGAPAK